MPFIPHTEDEIRDMLAAIGWQAKARHVSVSDPADSRLETLAQFHLATRWFPTGPDVSVGPGREQTIILNNPLG